MTTTPTPWRFGVELLKLSLVLCAMALLLKATQTVSGHCGSPEADCSRGEGRESAAWPGVQAWWQSPVSEPTRIDPSHSRGTSGQDTDWNDDDAVTRNDREARAPHPVRVDATGARVWRVTALGIDPAIFLEPATRSLRAPPP